MSNNYLIIDGSFYIFYRVCALNVWWKNAHKDEPIDNPIENAEFIDKFRSTFVNKIKEIKKKLKINDAKLLIGKDCPRNNIWRNEFHENYKGTRNNNCVVGPFFKLTYDEDLFKTAGADLILYHSKLEADDCIAIISKHIIKNDPNAKITIITSDTDYLQLIHDQIQILNMKLDSIDKKNSFKNPDKDLFCKLVLGDKSDNISGVFKKCGKKTAEKYYDNKDLFLQKLKNENLEDKFEYNNLLINFDKIPENLKSEFLQEHITKI